MAKKFKVGDRVRLDKKGNTGIISEITRGFAIIGRGPNSRQQDLKTLIRAKKK